MCGIVGVIPNSYLTIDDEVTFKQMLWADTLRGWDSTGVFKKNHKDKIEILKTIGIPTNLFALAEKEKFNFYGRFLVGHNRAATKGERISANAHPFKVEHITLVHNGTLFNHRKFSNHAVDSHGICELLSTNPDMQTFINTLDGAYALVWYNEENNTINILRNEERPLFLIKTEKSYYLTSEKELGIWILTRNKIKFSDIEEIQPFTHYAFNLKGMELTKTIYKEPEKKVFHSGNYSSVRYNERLSDDQLYLKAYIESQLKIKVGSTVSVEIINVIAPKYEKGTYEYRGELKADGSVLAKFFSIEKFEVGETILGNLQFIVDGDTVFITNPKKKNQHL